MGFRNLQEKLKKYISSRFKIQTNVTHPSNQILEEVEFDPPKSNYEQPHLLFVLRENPFRYDPGPPREARQPRLGPWLDFEN